jgi:uncharacterized protein YijF (DUF1287 family)
MTPDRRMVIGGLAVLGAAGCRGASTQIDPASKGARLAAAARGQIGVTTGYDPAYVKLPYPGGDVPRRTGVCADVIVRAGRDAFGLDLQRLVHEDMRRAFGAYPNRWGLKKPDRNIDHRRVPNLETYWRRQGAEVWRGRARGNDFPKGLEVGDILTWDCFLGGPHVGIVAEAGWNPKVVHNMGGGAEVSWLATFLPHRAVGQYRWPK